MMYNKVLFLVLASLCIDVIASEQPQTKRDAEPAAHLAVSTDAPAGASAAAASSQAHSPHHPASGSLSPNSDAGSSMMLASGLTTPPSSLTASYAGADVKHAAEDATALKDKLVALGQADPQSLINTTASACLELDQGSGSTHHMRLLWGTTTRLLFDVYPTVVNTNATTKTIQRTWRNMPPVAAAYFNQTHRHRLVNAMLAIPQDDSSYDFNALQEEIILHYCPDHFAGNKKAVGLRRNSFSEGSTPTTASQAQTSVQGIEERYAASLEAKFAAEAAQRIREEITPVVTKRVSHKVRAALHKELRPEVERAVRAEVTAEERNATRLRYLACAGAGCVLGAAAVWTYNAFSGTSTPSK